MAAAPVRQTRPVPVVVLVLALLMAVARPAARPAGAPTGSGQEPPTLVPTALTPALDLYARREFDEAAATLRQVPRFQFAEAQAWLDAGGTGPRGARPLVAALVALEYGRLRPFLVPPLVAWARGVLADGAAGPEAEALWLRASIALAEGAGRWAFLRTGVTPGLADAATAAGPTVGHIDYAYRRFPADPHFRMAGVVAVEVATSPAIAGDAALVGGYAPGFDRIEADVLGDGREAERRLLEQATAVLEVLLDDEDVGIEAHLRLGYILLRLGDVDGALRHFDQVVFRTDGGSARYLAHLYSGVALGRVNRAAEAAAAYRAALRVVPRARSAITLLTALLVMHGDLAEAEDLAADFLGAPPARVDPWRGYFQGDYGQFPALLARLRQAVR